MSWKPNKSQRRAFAINMQNPAFAKAYYAAKKSKAEKRRQASRYNYESAGGYYVPTKEQYNFCLENYHTFATREQQIAANEVISGYNSNEKIHHDYIHIINELRRKYNV